jgi:cobalt/nickel transport protein
MSSNFSRQRTRALVVTGLSAAVLIAVFLSNFASKNPDGLDRVSQDLGFNKKELEDKTANKLPFYQVFDQYALRGVPEQIGTPIAGLIGTLATFGLAWGIGSLVVRRSDPSSDEPSYPDRPD